MNVYQGRCEPVRIDRAFADLAASPVGGGPAVTIVTPFYNMADFIEETAESVFRQTVRDFEWMIVNDGSTNLRCAEVLDELARRDSRVRVLHQANLGPAAARNRGFREARGEYVAQLDADDLLAPTFLEKCLWFLETHPHHGWVWTGTVVFGDQRRSWLPDFRREELLKENVLVSISVVRKSAHRAIGGYDETIRQGHEDWDYWLRMVTSGVTSEAIPEYLCSYRQRSDSRIWETAGNPHRKQEFAELMRRRYEPAYKAGLPPALEPPWPPGYPLINDHLPLVNRHPADHRCGVLFLWPWLTMGGADKFNLDLLRGLDQSRLRPHIVTTIKSDNPWEDRFSEFTPQIFHLPNFLPVEDWLRFLVYLIRSRGISLIFISNSEYGYQCAPVLKKVFPHLKVIDFAHMEQMDWKGGGYAYASKSLSPLLSRSLVSSHHLRRIYIEEFSRDPAQVHCVYTNVDAEEEFSPERFVSGRLRGAVGCPPETPVLLYVARMCAQKRPQALIEIASRLRMRSRTAFQVWIVGDGPDLPEMKRRCSELGMDGTCVFWGGRRDTGQFYREADILVLPSEWEGISLTLYEAMAMGVPVVASDVGGQRELVTPETGALIPPGAADEIDQFVERILHLIEDPSARRRVGEAGRARVRTHFPLSRMVEAITRHMTAVMQDPGGSGPHPSDSTLWLDRYSRWLETHRLEALSHRMWQEKVERDNAAREAGGRSRPTQGGVVSPSDEVDRPARRAAPAHPGKVTVLMEVRSLDTGGMEETVWNLARSLNRDRFSVLIVCVERGGLVARRCREYGIPVEVLGERKEEEYAELLDRHQVDLVCAHYSTFGSRLAAREGVPVVSVIHNVYAWLSDAVFSEIKANDRYVSRYVAVSTGVARYAIRRFNISSAKVSVVPNGLDVEALAASEREPPQLSRKDFGVAEDDFLFLHVGAVTEVKGHNVLVRAMKEIARTHPHIKVLCVGDILSREYYDLTSARVKEWQLEAQIRFTGFVTRITDLYRLADAFVLPSLIEGWSLAVAEALFFGLPVVLTGAANADTFVNGDDVGRVIDDPYDGLLDVPPDDLRRHGLEEAPRNAPQLTEAMIDLYVRREQWKAAARKGREKILTSHALSVLAARYERVFLDEVLQAKQENERDVRRRLHEMRTLEEVRGRISEVRELLDPLRRQLGEIAAQGAEQAQRLATLEARHEAFGKEILDRLSFTKRMRARLTRGLEALDGLSSAIGRRVSARMSPALRAICARLPFWLRRRLVSAYYATRPSARPITHRYPPSGAGETPAGRAEAYRRRVEWIAGQAARIADGTAHRSALERILSEAPHERVAVYPPTILWGEQLFQRPQQIFRALARRGMASFYCSSNPFIDGVEGFKRLADRLYVSSDIQALRPLSECTQVILWMTRPDHWGFRDLFPGALTVYEMIDELEVFPEHCDAMERDHRLALAEADVVVATAENLCQRIRPFRDDVVLAPNAVCLEDFQAGAHTDAIPRDLERITRLGRPIVGYYGALAEWFDYELLDACAQRCPDLSFVLIGPDYDGSVRRLPARDNVLWLGPKPYEELRHYLQRFDVATIPFRINAITEATSPIKLFEYMAGGKPIVTTALPECRRYRSVLIGEGRDGFVAQLRVALEKRHDADYRLLLEQEAKENTWDARIEAILSCVSDAELRRRYKVGPRVLRAVCRQSAPNVGHAMHGTWLEFALSTNVRGETAVTTVRRYRSVGGARTLDIGCAYGGFPIAFARAGAEAVGIDINRALLELAAANVRDMDVPVSLHVKDVTDWGQLADLGTFDVITCNDLIEHVEDVPRAIAHVARLLNPRGLLYMQIPNGFSVGQVLKDGHYGLFGITLLPRPGAIAYFQECGHKDAYSVGHFHRLEEYLEMLAAHGIRLPDGEIANSLGDATGEIDRITASLEAIRQTAPSRLAADGLSASTKRVLEDAVGRYVAQVASDLAAYEATADAALKAQCARSLVTRYGIEFWDLIGIKAE